MVLHAGHKMLERNCQELLSLLQVLVGYFVICLLLLFFSSEMTWLH